MILRRVVSAGVAAILLAACGDTTTEPPGPGPVSEVTITLSSDTLNVAQSLQLTARAVDERGNPVPADFNFGVASAADTNIVRVQSNGMATGRAPGTATVTAFGAGRTAQAKITVRLGAPQVGAGTLSACGLLRTGEVLCWGSNNHGQLGDGTTNQSSVPVRVSGRHTFVSLAVGGSHACGLTAGGEVFCWGSNFFGQLGASSADTCTVSDRPAPCSRKPLGVAHDRFRSVSAGATHTCAITTSGAAKCWGSNASGQIGNGSTNNATMPAAVSGDLRFRSISAGGQHTCAITENSVAYCWGLNRSGQLGNGGTTDQRAPTRVSGDLVYASVSAGSKHTCARSTVNTVYCWGTNGNGRLGTGNLQSSSIPARVTGPELAVSAGENHTCAVFATTSDDGSVSCWGANDAGQLGNGSLTGSTSPTPVVGGQLFRSISAGHRFTCGITRENRAYCWGYNIAGQLGNGATDTSLAPTLVNGFGS